MVARTVGTGLFILGLLGMLGTATAAPQNQPANPEDRVGGQVSNYVIFGMTMAIGVWLRRSGEPKPALAPRRRDQGEVELQPERAVPMMTAERRSRKDDREPLGSDPEPGSRDTGSCRACGYRPVAYDADYCPACAAKNPNPGVVNRIVGKAMLLGGLACGLVGAAWGYFGLASGGAGGAIGGLLLGTLAGLVLGLVGGLIAGVAARLSGAR
jgi:hypothetical protein